MKRVFFFFKEEYERYHKQDPNKGAEGDMGYAGQNI